MEKTDIAQKAVELTLTWIDSLETCLAERGNQTLTKVVMKAAGEKCSVQILDDCRQILGKNPESVGQLLDAMNQRRLQKHNLASLWEKQGNKAHLIIEECNCTLVRAGLAKPNPVHCLCSLGLMESLFSAVCRGQVSVELVKSIGNGHDVCEFNVTFEE
jgi:predicted ArsR family transcriptional regulator